MSEFMRKLDKRHHPDGILPYIFRECEETQTHMCTFIQHLHAHTALLHTHVHTHTPPSTCHSTHTHTHSVVTPGCQSTPLGGKKKSKLTRKIFPIFGSASCCPVVLFVQGMTGECNAWAGIRCRSADGVQCPGKQAITEPSEQTKVVLQYLSLIGCPSVNTTAAAHLH